MPPPSSDSHRILVTGATGFVGTHLVEALVGRGHAVRALVRATSDVRRLEALGVERVVGGLDDEVALRRAIAGVDVVFHLAAATSARDEAGYVRVNAEGTRRLVEAVVAERRAVCGGRGEVVGGEGAGVGTGTGTGTGTGEGGDGGEVRPRRLVYLSSLAAVGPALAGRVVGVSDAPRPLTAYGRSKLAGEAACLGAGGGLEVVVLRAPAVYGPGDRELLRVFRLASLGLLPVPTGPARPIQLVHVRDLAEALVRVGEAGRCSGVFHVAEPRAYGWAELTELVARAVGRRGVRLPVPAAVVRGAAALSEWAAALGGRSTVFNREKARELLAPGWMCETEALRREVGFEASIPLAEGLAETAAWYRARRWL